MAKAHNFRQHQLKMFLLVDDLKLHHNFAPMNSIFVDIFLDYFFADEETFLDSFNSKRMIISSKLCTKKIGHRVR